jgi:hypothetical protein
MLSSSSNPVYAKQNLSPARSSGSRVLCQLLGIFLFFGVSVARADSLEDSARALARKVASAIRGGSVTCQVRNLSSLSPAEFASISSAFQDELQKHNLKILPADAPVSVVFSLTQNPTEYAGVVQIGRKENRETMMETLGLVRGPAAPGSSANYSFRRELLLSQEKPILDVVLDENGKEAASLGADEVVFYESRDNQWVPVRSEHLPLQRSPYRDLRGFLFLGADSSKTAFLPGELCRSTPGDARAWTCERYAGVMPVRAVPPDLISAKKMVAWFSAAKFEADGKPRVVVTGQDGLARLYEEGPEPVATFRNLGSEIAGLYSGCGSGWQLLATGKGDWTKPDEVQALEIRERRTQSVSAPLEFPGPVISLHAPMAKPLDDEGAHASAVAIDRNLQTGRYEAYRLTIACSN